MVYLLNWGPAWTFVLLVACAALVAWHCHRDRRLNPLSEVEAYRQCHEHGGRHPWES